MESTCLFFSNLIQKPKHKEKFAGTLALKVNSGGFYMNGHKSQGEGKPQPSCSDICHQGLAWNSTTMRTWLSSSFEKMRKMLSRCNKIHEQSPWNIGKVKPQTEVSSRWLAVSSFNGKTLEWKESGPWVHHWVSSALASLTLGLHRNSWCLWAWVLLPPSSGPILHPWPELCHSVPVSNPVSLTAFRPICTLSPEQDGL